MPIARTVCITGRVEGVFFREWAVKVASAIGVTGWVRNRSDGSVEVYAAGDPQHIERFIAEIRLGSPASRVDEVEVRPIPLENVSGFMRKASA